jgi:hypothetical protein
MAYTKELREQVVELVSYKLNQLPHHETHTTTELINWLADEIGIDNKLAAGILKAAAEHELIPYATKGDPVAGKGFQSGNIVRPWKWHAPIKGREAKPHNPPPPSQLDRIEAKLDELLSLLRPSDRTNGQRHPSDRTSADRQDTL